MTVGLKELQLALDKAAKAEAQLLVTVRRLQDLKAYLRHHPTCGIGPAAWLDEQARARAACTCGLDNLMDPNAALMHGGDR